MPKEKQIKYLIVPDVHGRDFWKEPVEETLRSSDARVIFLGDYLDPYPYEWEDRGADFDCRRHAIQNLESILYLKSQYPESITLLIGNHDCGYAIGDDICNCRMDFRNKEEIESLFSACRDRFKLAEECDIAGKKFIFSHAGILKGWAEKVFGKNAVAGKDFNVVDRLNMAWRAKAWNILDTLGHYDGYRGYLGYKYGSPVWSDVRSWVRVTPEETFGFNIVGHTQCDEPVVLDQIADLDCRKCFYLDDQGQIHDWETDEVLHKTREE